jgi:hypothetical protein
MATNSFSLADWADYVRGLAAPELHAEMARALAAGDPESRDAEARMREVLAVHRLEAEHPVPERLLTWAASMFRLHGPAATAQARPNRLLSLVFDSFLAPLPAGVRSASPTSWQGVFESEDLSVDLRLDRHRRQPRVTAVGQIAERGPGGRSLARLPALIEVDGNLEATTKTDPHGQFVLEFPIGSFSEIRILVEPEGFLTLPLSTILTRLLGASPGSSVPPEA